MLSSLRLSALDECNYIFLYEALRSLWPLPLTIREEKKKYPLCVNKCRLKGKKLH